MYATPSLRSAIMAYVYTRSRFVGVVAHPILLFIRGGSAAAFFTNNVPSSLRAVSIVSFFVVAVSEQRFLPPESVYTERKKKSFALVYTWYFRAVVRNTFYKRQEKAVSNGFLI